MCLGIPLRIVQIDGMEAIGEMNGIKNKIRIDLLPNVKIGDFVMIHAGFGIEILDEKLAQETIETMLEIEELMVNDSSLIINHGENHGGR